MEAGQRLFSQCDESVTLVIQKATATSPQTWHEDQTLPLSPKGPGSMPSSWRGRQRSWGRGKMQVSTCLFLAHHTPTCPMIPLSLTAMTAQGQVQPGHAEWRDTPGAWASLLQGTEGFQEGTRVWLHSDAAIGNMSTYSGRCHRRKVTNLSPTETPLGFRNASHPLLPFPQTPRTCDVSLGHAYPFHR